MGQREDIAELRAELRELRGMVRQCPVDAIGRNLDATIRRVRQASHGLVVGNVIRHNGTAWVKSLADTAENGVVGGVVVAIMSADVFIYATGGYVDVLTGLTAGSVHYLSDATAGTLTTTAPSIAIPVIHADSTTSGVIMAGWPAAAGTAGGGIWVPPTSLGYVTSAGSGTLTAAPSNGTMVFILLGGGGGGCAAGSFGTAGYIAASSGGAVTTAVTRAYGGGGGGGGGLCYGGTRVTAGTTATYVVGSGGAKGNPGSDGGDTTLTVGVYTFRAEGGGGGGAAGVGAPAKYRGGGSNSSINADASFTANTLFLFKMAGATGGDGAYAVVPNAVVLYGGLGAAGRDPSSGASTSGGGAGENYTVGTGGAGNHTNGADGLLAVGFIPDA